MSPETSSLPELCDAHASKRFGPYLRDVFERRSYVWYVAMSELRSRQITNVLGNLWHLLNPALNIAVYYLIFGLLLGTDRGVDNFVLFLAAGLFVFQLTQKVTTDGARSLINNKSLLRAIKFPRALLPLTSTVTETLAASSMFVVLFVVALLTGEPITLRWLVLPLVLVLQFVFNVGAAMVAARLTVHFADVTQILPFFFRLLLYASGVIFSVDAALEDHPSLEPLFTLNPMYCFLSLGRWCVIDGQAIDPDLVVSAIVWSVALCVGGFFFFRAGEDVFGRD